MATDPKSTYYDVGGIETIDIIKAKLSVEEYQGFLRGLILKYACRLRYKDDPARDSEKIHVYSMLLKQSLEENVTQS